MIRPANFSDIPRLAALMAEAHARSKYADRCGLDLKFTKALFVRAIQRHGGTGDGATCLFVSDNDGVQGFILGLLDRVYQVGDKLAALDAFYYAAHDIAPRDPARLIDAYVEWAGRSPNCIEIKLSATDVVGPTERVERLYRRKGFVRSGVIYERTAP